ncbi:hypothetical protein GMSM_19640 [Geomonas sp. Red276]
MRANIIRIGNSQGIRIPKVLLEQTRLGTEVELEVEEDRLVIRAVTRPRMEWEQKFQATAQCGDGKMLDEDLGEQTEWDKDEWEW